MGVSSGLGSEFNHYLIQSTLQAILESRRMVYLRTPDKKWDWYDCDEKLGWACYLRFRCGNPYGVDIKDVNRSNPDIAIQDRSRRILYQRGMYGSVVNTIKEIFNHYQRLNLISKDLTCDIDASNINPTITSSIIAKFLYRLQPNVTSVVKKVKTHYETLVESGYFSLQLRMTDKTAEMSKLAWNWITNSTKIAYFMKPYFEAYPNIKKIYTGINYIYFLFSFSFCIYLFFEHIYFFNCYFYYSYR